MNNPIKSHWTWLMALCSVFTLCFTDDSPISSPVPAAAGGLRSAISGTLQNIGSSRHTVWLCVCVCVCSCQVRLWFLFFCFFEYFVCICLFSVNLLLVYAPLTLCRPLPPNKLTKRVCVCLSDVLNLWHWNNHLFIKLFIFFYFFFKGCPMITFCRCCPNTWRHGLILWKCLGLRFHDFSMPNKSLSRCRRNDQPALFLWVTVKPFRKPIPEYERSCGVIKDGDSDPQHINISNTLNTPAHGTLAFTWHP